MSAILRIPAVKAFMNSVGNITVELREGELGKHELSFSVGEWSEKRVIVGLSEGDFLDIVPVPYGFGMTSNCLMYKMSSPVILPAYKEATLSLQAPFSLGVFHGETLLTVFSFPQEKLALYGTPDIGSICVYLNERLLEEFLSTGLNPAILRVRVVNTAGRKAEISRLVFPIKSAGLYYAKDVGFAYSEFSVKVEEKLGNFVAEVSVSPNYPASYTVIKEFHRAKRDTYFMNYGI